MADPTDIREAMESRHERRRREREESAVRSDEERARRQRDEQTRMQARILRCAWCGYTMVQDEGDLPLLRCPGCDRLYDDAPAAHDEEFVRDEIPMAVERRQCAAIEAVAEAGGELADQAGAFVELVSEIARELASRAGKR